MIKGVLASVAILASSQSAQAEWVSRYLDSDDANHLNTCVAGQYFSDGPFLLRIHADVIDFFLSDDSFALPPNQVLGHIAFIFKADNFVLAAESGNPIQGRTTSDHLFLTPDKTEYEAILQALRYSSEFAIVFPDETNFTIPLEGSDSAITQAFECWNQNTTGPAGSNPFGDTQSSSEAPNNPFD